VSREREFEMPVEIDEPAHFTVAEPGMVDTSLVQGGNIFTNRLQEEKSAMEPPIEGRPAKEVLRDYLSGIPDVTFDDIKPVTVTVAPKAKAIYVVPGIPLHIRPQLQGQEIILLPQIDEQRRYQWLEGFLSVNDMPEGESLLSARIKDGKLVQKGWHGPEKQLLKDYLAGELPFENLRPIHLTRLQTDVVTLWKEEGKKFYLAASQHFGLGEGNSFSLVPQEETSDQVRFAVMKEGKNLGFYSLHKADRIFRLDEITGSKREWTFIYDEDRQAYVDYAGERWVNTNQLQQRYHIAADTVRRLLQDVPVQAGTCRICTFGMRETNFYKEQDAVKAIETSGYLEKKPIYNKARKPDGYWTIEQIEIEAKTFYEAEGVLTFTALRERGRGDLAAQIVRYPGKLMNLKASLGISKPKPEGIPAKPKKKRIDWVGLRENPEQLQAFIEAEIQKFLDAGNLLTTRGLIDAGLNSLLIGIVRYYPGGMSGLKSTLLGVEDNSNNSGEVHYDDTGIPRYSNSDIAWNHLKNNPEQLASFIETEISLYLHEGGVLTYGELEKAGWGTFCIGINGYYPGRITALKEKFGIPVKHVKPTGYWTIETIEKEAKEFYYTYGSLSDATLTNHGRLDLEGAIARYPGKMTGLKQQLGIETRQKPAGYWTPEHIEAEAVSFYQTHGVLSQNACAEHGRQDLNGAIQRYPGKMAALKEKLGINASRKDKYWTVENIEDEAQNFYAANGVLTKAAIEKDRADLANAIRRHYPGGYYALQQNLLGEGLKTPHEFWVGEDGPQHIRDAAYAIYLQEGKLTSILAKRRRRGLDHAIRRYYPGGWPQLLVDLKIAIQELSPSHKQIVISPAEANEELLQFLENEER
jgi:hypothetical protein